MSNEKAPDGSGGGRGSEELAGVQQVPTIAPLSAYLVRALRHELVQPLHSISLMIDLAPIQGRDGEVVEWTARIDRALDGMKRMLNGLGEASRYELEPPVPVFAEQPLEPVLRALVEQFRDRATHAGMTISLSLQPLSVVTDGSVLRVGLERLLDNAVRHSQASAVVVELQRAEGAIRLMVRDDGIGLDGADIERCLAPLGTGSVARIKGTSGLGLGLTIAQQVARTLALRFEFRSEPGRGTSAGYIVSDA